MDNNCTTLAIKRKILQNMSKDSIPIRLIHEFINGHFISFQWPKQSFEIWLSEPKSKFYINVYGNNCFSCLSIQDHYNVLEHLLNYKENIEILFHHQI